MNTIEREKAPRRRQPSLAEESRVIFCVVFLLVFPCYFSLLWCIRCPHNHLSASERYPDQVWRASSDDMWPPAQPLSSATFTAEQLLPSRSVVLNLLAFYIQFLML